MSDVRRIRIVSGSSGIERITMPPDCSIEFVNETSQQFIGQYSNSTPAFQTINTPVLFVKRGGDILARFGGVTSWRDESITVEKGTITASGLSWSETA